LLLATREQRKLIYNVIGLAPSPLQEPIAYDNHKRCLVTGGIRSGKSEIAADKMTSQYWLGKLYWLLGLDYEMCRPEFGYLVRNFEKLGLVKHCQFPSRDQCLLEIAPDIIIETKSAKYPEKIAGKAPDGIILCEAGQLSYDIFLRAVERLSEKDGWLFGCGTLELLEGTDWYPEKCKEYSIPDNEEDGMSYTLPSWGNTAIFPGGRDDPKLKTQEIELGTELFLQRFGGEIPKPRGLVIPEFRVSLHTGSYPRDPGEPVFVGIDPGHYPSAYAVEVVQFIGDQIRVIDEIYVQDKTHEQVCLALMQKPYADKIIGGAIDIASKQQDGRQPIYDIWVKETGLKLSTRRIRPVEDGVSRLRSFLFRNPISGEVPLCIDNKCRGLISEFGGSKSPFEGRGAWKMDMDRRGNIMGIGRPSEKNCDAAKALIYCIVERKGLGIPHKKRSVSYIDI